MNKVELVTKTAEVSGLTKKDVELALKTLITVTEDTVATGEKVQLVGFGTFEPRERAAQAAHKGRNPRTSEEVDVEAKPAKKTVGFKAGKEFKSKVEGTK